MEEIEFTTHGMEPIFRIDLDDPKHRDFIEGWGGQTIARANVYQGGKRCTVHFGIYLDLNGHAKMTLTYVGPSRDVKRVLTARPWTMTKPSEGKRHASRDHRPGDGAGRASRGGPTGTTRPGPT